MSTLHVDYLDMLFDYLYNVSNSYYLFYHFINDIYCFVKLMR